jgi:hypothetical protein
MAAGWFDVEGTNVPVFATCGRGVLPAAGLGIAVLVGVLPPCVLAILAAKSCASFSPNFQACVSAAFSHAKASCASDLRVITPLGPGILIVA